MGLLEQCGEAFGAGDLYQVLGVARGASAEEIRRGYRKASLHVHPDRADLADKERATQRFQVRFGSVVSSSSPYDAAAVLPSVLAEAGRNVTGDASLGWGVG